MQIHRYWHIFLLGIFWLLPTPDAQAFACVKSMRWVDGPPYAFKDTNGQILGLHIDLVREALRRMNCDIRFIEMPWGRAIIELERGRLDVLAGAAVTQDRKEFAIFSMPTNKARSVLFVRVEGEKKYQINKLVDILGTNFRLATQINASMGYEYDLLIKDTKFLKHLTFIHSPSSGWLMMEKNRIDGQIADELTGMYRIKQLGLDQVIKPSKLRTSKKADFVAFSKKTTDVQFVKNFDAALSAMIVDGTYKEILARYLSCPINMKNLGCQ